MPFKYLYLGLGHLFVAIGFIGIVIPLLPTTPFLILAAMFYAKGSAYFHDWLINHPKLGKHIQAWRQHRIIPKKAKILATVVIIVHLIFPLHIIMLATWLRAMIAFMMILVIGTIWSFPSKPQS